MVYMSHQFRGALLDREVLCLKVLGLRELDHEVVVPGVVWIVAHTIPDHVAVALRPTASADLVFPIEELATLLWDMMLMVFFLTLLLGILPNTGHIVPTLTPVLRGMLTPCLPSIDAVSGHGEHVASRFRLFSPHDREYKMVLQRPQPLELE